MSSLASYTLGGLALVLALDFAAPSVATGLARALYETQPQASFAARYSPATSPHGATSQAVDRSRKGARLPVAADASNVSNVAKNVLNSDATRSPVQQPVRILPNPVRDVGREDVQDAKPAKTPVGCDPAFSPLSKAAPARFIGRCVA